MNVMLALVLALIVPALPVVRCGQIQENSSVSLTDLRNSPTEVMLDGRSVSLTTYVWRNLMPGSWSIEGSPLMGTFQITTADKQPLPSGIRVDRAWFVFGDQSWEVTNFRDHRPGQEREKDGWINCPQLPACEVTARGGPRWGPGVIIDVVVRFTDRDGKSYFLQAPHQPVRATN
jgi:hypothetical protein